MSFLVVSYMIVCPGGGGGIFLACEDFGRMFDNSFPACVSFFLFLKWKLPRAH